MPPEFSLSAGLLNLLPAIRRFLGSGPLVLILCFRAAERVTRAFVRLWRCFKTRCPLSLLIEVRRFEDLMDAASESLLERGGFSTQNSVKASWLLFERRRANGMVSVLGHDSFEERFTENKKGMNDDHQIYRQQPSIPILLPKKLLTVKKKTRNVGPVSNSC